jgi:hypothetical protein
MASTAADYVRAFSTTKMLIERKEMYALCTPGSAFMGKTLMDRGVLRVS